MSLLNGPRFLQMNKKKGRKKEKVRRNKEKRVYERKNKWGARKKEKCQPRATAVQLAKLIPQPLKILTLNTERWYSHYKCSHLDRARTKSPRLTQELRAIKYDETNHYTNSGRKISHTCRLLVKSTFCDRGLKWKEGNESGIMWHKK